MSVSKVIFGTETLIDITDTTAIAEDVAQGKTFLSASGVLTTGTNQGGGGTPEAHTITIDSLSKSNSNRSVSTLQQQSSEGSAVVYNGELHILGSYLNIKKQHRKWDGTSWTTVSTLPYNFYYGSAVIYNNEIHILGGTDSATNHYKWDGTSWTSVSTLPYEFISGCAVVYNNEIHILGSSNSSYRTAHYKWNGTSWVSVSTLPYSFYGGGAVVYNNEIHILGSGTNSTYYKYHYKWDGTSWSSVSTLPYNFYYCGAVVINNKIHIMGGDSSVMSYHYLWDGVSWTSVSTLPYDFRLGYSVVYNNEIHILGGRETNTYTNHYAIQTEPITSANTITSNGIYNIVGSKTETALDKLISNLTAKTGTTIDVNIDMSATATADKIMQGYTAWANGVKLTGTASGGGGYLQKGTSSSNTSLTFSGLSIPYADITSYYLICIILDGSTSYRWLYNVNNTSGSMTAYAIRYNSISWTLSSVTATSYITVSGSGNSITFTSTNNNYRFSASSYAYVLMYC